MLIIGIILLVFAVFLIGAVLMQQGKSHNLSGTIAGGAETFFGKSKAQSINKKLSILTTIIAIVFVLLVCTVYVLQENTQKFDWSMLNPFGGSEQSMTDAHDHNNDGVADHTAEEHNAATKEESKGESKEESKEESGAADSNAADSEAAPESDAAADSEAAPESDAAADSDAAESDAAESETAE